jgi:hypothetical protein
MVNEKAVSVEANSRDDRVSHGYHRIWDELWDIGRRLRVRFPLPACAKGRQAILCTRFVLINFITYNLDTLTHLIYNNLGAWSVCAIELFSSISLPLTFRGLSDWQTCLSVSDRLEIGRQIQRFLSWICQSTTSRWQRT